MNALCEILLIARMEAGLLRRFPRLYLTVIGAVVAGEPEVLVDGAPRTSDGGHRHFG